MGRERVNDTVVRNERQWQTTSPLKHAVATQATAALACVMLYPIDVVKVRFMSQDGTFYRQHNGQTYRSIGKALSTIYREEGLCALFRGCHVAVMGSVFSWGVYMYMYRSLCNFFNELGSQLTRGEFEDFAVRSFLSGIASSCSAVFCNPIWLIKTRMQIEEISLFSTGIRAGNYSSFFCSLMFIIRSTGFLSLWRGLSAQVLLGIPNAFNLPFYETLKWYRLRDTGQNNLKLWEVCVCSTISKSVIAFLAQPICVIKTRLQDQRSRCGVLQYVSLRQSVLVIWKNYGLRGMYRGTVPCLLQTVPRSVLTFVFYELAMRLFG